MSRLRSRSDARSATGYLSSLLPESVSIGKISYGRLKNNYYICRVVRSVPDSSQIKVLSNAKSISVQRRNCRTSRRDEVYFGASPTPELPGLQDETKFISDQVQGGQATKEGVYLCKLPTEDARSNAGIARTSRRDEVYFGPSPRRTSDEGGSLLV